METLRQHSILDGKYRIESVLGSGGFGITYRAVNIRLEMVVAIKELYWRDRCSRSGESGRVGVSDPDAAAFEKMKLRFLEEARILRDLSAEPGIVRILDYFEANGTAYLVMEFIEGSTLDHVLDVGGPMPAETAFQRFLPLMDVLSRLHEKKMLHRDISPDNIMVLPDGSMKLIDFGAARTFSEEDPVQYTAFTKSSYSPPEQFDKLGNQGPWTDIYALSATLYRAITGTVPESALARLFVQDCFKKPSDIGAEITPDLEAVIVLGMELSPENRYTSLREMITELRKALPDAVSTSVPASPPAAQRRRLWPFFAAAAFLLISAAFIIIILFSPKDRFAGEKTVCFYLSAPSQLTASDFKEAYTLLSERLTAFAGENRFLLEKDGYNLSATVPLSCFGSSGISDVLDEMCSLIPGKSFAVKYDPVVTWETPDENAGSRQVGGNYAFNEPTLVLLYDIKSPEKLNTLYRTLLISSLKTRLNALGAPYACGTPHGKPDTLAFRVPVRVLNSFIIYTLGDHELMLTDGNNKSVSDALYLRQPARLVTEADGTVSLCLTVSASTNRILNRTPSGETTTLFLEAYDAFSTVAEVTLSEQDLLSDDPITLTFRDFRFSAADSGPDVSEAVQTARRITLDYLIAFLNDTELPLNIRGCTWTYLAYYDSEGNFVPNSGASLPVFVRDNPLQERIKNLIQMLGAEKSVIDVYNNGSRLAICFPGEPGSNQFSRAFENLVRIFREYRLYEQNVPITVCLTNETTERCRILFECEKPDGYISYEKKLGMYGNLVIIAPTKTDPILNYESLLNEYWDNLPESLNES